MTETFKDWAIAQHEKTNHFYDDYLPYKFHLQMVENEVAYYIRNRQFENKELYDLLDGYGSILLNAAWGHDLLEDTRVSYNEILIRTDKLTADIIFALTNEKGKNRKERASDSYYRGIRETKGAAFVKLCDRIANVKYGIMTRNKRMTEMYKKENEHFINSIYSIDLAPLRLHLEKLFLIQEL